MALRIPRRLKTEVAASFRFFSIERHEMDTPGHVTHTFNFHDWVSVVAIDEAGDFVLVRQHRHGVNQVTVEVAGGIIDAGEDPREAGIRELLEETGYGGGEVESLGFVHPNAAMQANRCFFFLARGVKRVAEIKTDHEESTEAVVLSRDAVRKALDDGSISHALAVVALERALRLDASKP